MNVSGSEYILNRKRCNYPQGNYSWFGNRFISSDRLQTGSNFQSPLLPGIERFFRYHDEAIGLRFLLILFYVFPTCVGTIAVLPSSIPIEQFRRKLEVIG